MHMHPRADIASTIDILYTKAEIRPHILQLYKVYLSLIQQDLDKNIVIDEVVDELRQIYANILANKLMLSPSDIELVRFAINEILKEIKRPMITKDWQMLPPSPTLVPVNEIKDCSEGDFFQLLIKVCPTVKAQAEEIQNKSVSFAEKLSEVRDAVSELIDTSSSQPLLLKQLRKIDDLISQKLSFEIDKELKFSLK